MKQFILLFFLGVSTVLSAQQADYNLEDGYIANSYDVVSYFTSKNLQKEIKNTKPLTMVLNLNFLQRKI